ncbi:MAG: hypothetical protein ACREOM_04285 [Candidatus Dormibacteraceae bacterium]
MYEYHKYEDVAWQRLQDVQREIENSRLMAAGIQQAWATLRLLAVRGWLLGGLASLRAPRRRPVVAERATDDVQKASDAA